MRPNLLAELLACNPDPTTYKAIELVTCQWVDPKENVLDSRLSLDIKDLEKLTPDDLWEYFETGHLIRELINFTIVAFQRGRIDEGVSTPDLVDLDIWPEFTDVDQADVLKLFKFTSVEDMIDTLREHMGLLDFLDAETEITPLDADLARLASSLVYREHAESGHTVKASPRLRHFVKSVMNETVYEMDIKDDLEHLMTGWSLEIFKPIQKSITWVELAINRGILVSGRDS